jgi:transposase-like protein
MKKRFTEEQIVAILREGQVGQKTVEQLCREHGISSPTYYVWKRKFGLMNEPDVSRMVIHVGAPVASQQSRILRVDRTSVTKTKGAGKVSAQIA